jgi:hypothetical protein
MWHHWAKVRYLLNFFSAAQVPFLYSRILCLKGIALPHLVLFREIVDLCFILNQAFATKCTVNIECRSYFLSKLEPRTLGPSYSGFAHPR